MTLVTWTSPAPLALARCAWGGVHFPRSHGEEFLPKDYTGGAAPHQQSEGCLEHLLPAKKVRPVYPAPSNELAIAIPMKILIIDIGGAHVKFKVSYQKRSGVFDPAKNSPRPPRSERSLISQKTGITLSRSAFPAGSSKASRRPSHPSWARAGSILIFPRYSSVRSAA